MVFCRQAETQRGKRTGGYKGWVGHKGLGGFNRHCAIPKIDPSPNFSFVFFKKESFVSIYTKTKRAERERESSTL